MTIECDELWSYVFLKKNQLWIWLAIDQDTREIVGVAVGDRSHKTATQLWDSLPGVYRNAINLRKNFYIQLVIKKNRVITV